MKKTNAARLLDAKEVSYSLTAYEVDESDLSAITLAKKIGQDVGQIFKTLVMRGDKTGILVAVIPGDEEVDLKKAAKISGNKSCTMVQQKDLLQLTGYIRGGCSPLGMKKPYSIFIHESCWLYDRIFISGGQRGLQIKLRSEDLVAITKATVCDLTE